MLLTTGMNYVAPRNRHWLAYANYPAIYSHAPRPP